MKATSTRAFTVLRFIVCACGEEPRQYATEAEAVREAQAAAKRTGWADLHKVLGEPATDLWRAPELKAEYEHPDGEGGLAA